MTEKIYTKTGDTGETGLFGGARVAKSDTRVTAYGDVDETNAVIGWAILEQKDDEVITRLRSVQSDLFNIGAHLATVVRPGRPAPALPAMPVQRIAEMEQWIDAADAELPKLTAFILPGGTRAAAALHVARTVCRRAERSVVFLAQHETVAAEILIYLNRLSDFLFQTARLVNHRAGTDEIRWQP
jgi:cob(I)alamin adenosyltransferase